MIWQDVVIMVCCFGFSFALIPAIKSKNKPPRSSCLLTSVLLATMAICFLTLRLWLSFSAEVTSLIAWIVLLVQKRS